MANSNGGATLRLYSSKALATDPRSTLSACNTKNCYTELAAARSKWRQQFYGGMMESSSDVCHINCVRVPVIWHFCHCLGLAQGLSSLSSRLSQDFSQLSSFTAPGH